MNKSTFVFLTNIFVGVETHNLHATCYALYQKVITDIVIIKQAGLEPACLSIHLVDILSCVKSLHTSPQKPPPSL